MNYSTTLRVTIDGRGAQQGARQVATGTQKVRQEFSRTDQNARKLRTALFDLRLMLFSLGGAAVVGGLFRLNDAFTEQTSKLKLVTSSERELVRVRGRLLEISQEARVTQDATITLYSRMTRALRGMNVSEQERLRITESVVKAVQVSGATVSEAHGAIIQLTQGLAANQIRGQEFNSVYEQTPRVMQLIMDSLGKTSGELRAMANEGKLTADVFVNAVKTQAGVIDEEFSRIERTVGQAFVQLANALQQVIGSSTEFDSVTQVVVAVIDELRESLEGTSEVFRVVGNVIEAVAIAGLTVLAGAALSSAAAVGTLTVSMGALRLAMAAHPLLTIATVVGAGVLAVKEFFNWIDKLETPIDKVADAQMNLNQQLTLQVELQKMLAEQGINDPLTDAIGDTMDRIRTRIEEAKKALQEAIALEERLRSISVFRNEDEGGGVVRARQRLAELEEALRLAAAGYTRAAQEALKLAEAEQEVIRVSEESTATFLDYLAEFDEGIAKAVKYRDALMEVDEAVLDEKLTAEQALIVKRFLTDAYNDNSEALRKVAEEERKLREERVAREKADRELMNTSYEVIESYDDFILSLENERLSLTLTGEALVEHNRQMFISEQLARAAATGADFHAESVARQAEELFNLRLAQEKANEEIKRQEELAKPYKDAWSRTISTIDQAFISMWEGAFDSFSDFADRLKDAFKSLIAQLIHLSITRPIMMNFMGAMGPSGSAGQLFNAGFSGITNYLLGGGQQGGMPGMGQLTGAAAGIGQFGVNLATLLGGQNAGYAVAGSGGGAGFLGAIGLPLLGGAATAGMGRYGGAYGGAIGGAIATGTSIFGGTGAAFVSQLGITSAVSGTALGAELGTAVIPVIGTIIGAILGAAFGRMLNNNTNPSSQISFGQARGAQDVQLTKDFGAVFLGSGRDGFHEYKDEIAKPFQEFFGYLSQVVSDTQREAITAALAGMGDIQITREMLAEGNFFEASGVFDAVLGALDPAIQDFVRRMGGDIEAQIRAMDMGIKLEQLVDATDLFEDLADALEQFEPLLGMDVDVRAVVGGMELLSSAFDLLDISTSDLGTSLALLSHEMIEAAGGLDRAAALWQAFFQGYLSEAERAAFAAEQAAATARSELEDVGLADELTSYTREGLRTMFEELLPTLSGQQLTDWLEALAAFAGWLDTTTRQIDEAVGSNVSLVTGTGGVGVLPDRPGTPGVFELGGGGPMVVTRDPVPVTVTNVDELSPIRAGITNQIQQSLADAQATASRLVTRIFGTRVDAIDRRLEEIAAMGPIAQLLVYRSEREALESERSSILEAQRAAEQYSLGSQLAQQIADISGITGNDFGTVASNLGFGLDQLANLMGISVPDLIDQMRVMQEESIRLSDLRTLIEGHATTIVDALKGNWQWDTAPGTPGPKTDKAEEDVKTEAFLERMELAAERMLQAGDQMAFAASRGVNRVASSIVPNFPPKPPKATVKGG